jgi:hypothetical protein
MSVEEVALRKQLLQARCAFYRLRIQHELKVAGDRLQWAKLGAKTLAALPLRSVLLAIAIKYFSRGRMSRWTAFAAKALQLRKLWRVFFA